jgi:hypothetical protein
MFFGTQAGPLTKMHTVKILIHGLVTLLFLLGCPEEEVENQPDPQPSVIPDGGPLLNDAGTVFSDAGTPFVPPTSVDGGGPTLEESFDGGSSSFWPSSQALFPITGQGTIAETLTSIEGQSCFFDVDRFLVMNDFELVYWHWAGLSERHHTSPNGALVDCVTLEDGTPMLITTETIWLFNGLDWIVSPLAEVLDDRILMDVAHLWREDIGDTLFFAFDSVLTYWAESTVYDVEVEGLPTTAASLSAGPIQIESTLRGNGVWVHSGSWVYALTPEGHGFEAYLLNDSGDVTQMAAFGEHHFAMAMDGLLYVHDGVQRQTYLLPENVTQVWGIPGQADLFMGENHPEWWFRPDGNLVQFLNMPSQGSWTLDPSGDFIVERTDGISRQHRNPYLRWRGLEENTALQDNAYVSLVYGGWGLVSELQITHNGQDIELDLDEGVLLNLAPANAANWVLDDNGEAVNRPEQLFDGQHILTASIQFEDDIEIEASLEFVVGDWRVPTWTEDVKIVYDARCAQCHFESSSTFALHEYSNWVDDFETIYLALESGQMPLPLGDDDTLLTPLQLEMLSRWQLAGFPQTPEDIQIIEPDWRWATHIEPLFETHCVNCHGPQGGGHSLDEASEWEAEIDNIISNLESGVMPLSADPLPASDIDTVRSWKEAGFPL